MLHDTRLIREFTSAIWQSQEAIIELDECCEGFLRKTFPEIGELNIYDILDDVVYKVAHQLEIEIKRCHDNKTIPRYEFGKVANIVHRARDIRIDEIKIAIKSITWRDFEHLCQHILEANQIKDSKVNRGTKENGIDFFGLLKMQDFNESNLFDELQIRIIGQARHHKSNQKVGGPEIKLFSKQISDFREEKGKGYDIAPAWFKNLKCPLLGIFITNTTFTSGADDAAKEEGILLKNGDQLAESIIKSSLITEWLK